MNNPTSLAQSLFADQVDPEELGQVALEFFWMAAYQSSKEVIYHRTGQPPALHFLYSGDRLNGVKSGPGLSDGDISAIQDKIKTDLLNLSKKIIGKAILFSGYPINGHFRIDNFFQICPVPDHAPKPKDFWEGDFPF